MTSASPEVSGGARGADFPEFDPDTPEFRADPYPTYRRMRATGTVARSTTHKFWFLSRHADVTAAFHHPGLGHGEKRVVPGESDPAPASLPLETAAALWLLFKDPPDHTRMRRVMQPAFTAIPFAELSARIDGVAHRLLSPMLERGQADFMCDFAFPLPLLSIANILGIPESDQAMFLEWAREVWGIFDLALNEDALRQGSKWVVKVEEYFRALLAERRARPGRDLTSALIAAGRGTDRLTDDEITANCVLMLFAGHDTTAHLLGNGLLALLQHPDQLQRMRAEPGNDETAVSELLRFNSPQQLAFRNALEDVVIAGVPIARGEKVCMGIGSANRDPAAFDDPDRLDLHRSRLTHVAFGGGIHACIGARIGRFTGRIGFRALLTRAAKIELRGYEWEPTVLIRGLHRLDVSIA